MKPRTNKRWKEQRERKKHNPYKVKLAIVLGRYERLGDPTPKAGRMTLTQLAAKVGLKYYTARSILVRYKREGYYLRPPEVL